jgi:hypothetical protein
VQRKLEFTPTADDQLSTLENNLASAAVAKQVNKTLGFLETNPNHPGLNSHEFTSLCGAGGEKVFVSFAQNNTPGAYRIFWHYGPDQRAGKKRIPVITVIAITPHP